MRDDKEPKENKSRPRFPDESEGAKERRGGHIINIRPPPSLHTRKNLIKKNDNSKKVTILVSAMPNFNVQHKIFYFYFSKVFLCFRREFETRKLKIEAGNSKWWAFEKCIRHRPMIKGHIKLLNCTSSPLFIEWFATSGAVCTRVINIGLHTTRVCCCCCCVFSSVKKKWVALIFSDSFYSVCVLLSIFFCLNLCNHVGVRDCIALCVQSRSLLHSPMVLEA